LARCGLLREIDAIVAYLEVKVVGNGPSTVADCEDYFGQGSKRWPGDGRR